MAKIVNVACDEKVLNEKGRIDSVKSDMILYDPFGTNYVTLGDVVGTPWREGKKYIK